MGLGKAKKVRAYFANNKPLGEDIRKKNPPPRSLTSDLHMICIYSIPQVPIAKGILRLYLNLDCLLSII